jgi:hypothetical protein
MVPRAGGLLARLLIPTVLLAFLTEADLDAFVSAYQASGFRGGLNLHRNLDSNAELMRAFVGRQVEVPALFALGSRDPGLAMPGMREIIAGVGRSCRTCAPA